MNNPRLNCYSRDLQLFIKKRPRPQNLGSNQKASIPYRAGLLVNEIWTDTDIQIGIFHCSLTLTYSHPEFFLWES